MKKVFTLLLLLLTSFSFSFAQTTQSSYAKTAPDMLKKMKSTPSRRKIRSPRMVSSVEKEHTN